MRTILALCTLACVFTPPITAQTMDKEKLREQARVVAVSLDLSFRSPCFPLSAGEEELDPAELQTQIELRAKLLRDDPTNVENRGKLCQLHFQAGQFDKAKVQQRIVIDHYRNRVAASPGDVDALRSLARWLDFPADQDEIEHVWQTVLKLQPKAADAFAGLGALRSARAMALNEAVRADMAQRREESKDVDKASVIWQRRDKLDAAKKLVAEGLEYINRAIEVAPAEASNYFARCNLRMLKNGLWRPAKDLTAEQSASLIEDYLQDMRLAADADVENPRAAILGLYFEWALLATRVGANPAKKLPNAWSELSKEQRDGISVWLDRLARIATGSDERRAAESLEALAYFRGIFSYEADKKENLLRRAVSLDPSRQASWNFLLTGLLQQRKLPDLRDACQTRLQHKDDIPTRLALAYAHDRLNEPDKAEEQVRIVLKQEPNNVVANLGLAMVLLKKSKTDADLDAAGKQLDATHLILRDAPGTQYRSEMLLARGIYFGLKGDVKGARGFLEQALFWDDKNAEAKAALAALGK
jgi:hypothetical protein